MHSARFMILEIDGSAGEIRLQLTDASENFLESGNIVAGSPKCFKAVLQVVKPLLG